MVGNISTFLGLEIVGISARREGDVYRFSCPKCGSPSVANRHHSHCSNKHCSLFVASGVDMVAAQATGGSYKEAHELIAQISPNSRAKTDFEAQEAIRMVFNWWVAHKAKSLSSMKAKLKHLCRKKGLYMDEQDFGITLIDHTELQDLHKLATQTGGHAEEGMFKHKGSFMAFSVQTQPNKIDRIIVMNERGAEYSFIWNNLDRGLVSLADITPDSGALIYGNLRQMMLGKREATDSGNDCRSTAYWMHRARYRIPNPEKIILPEGAKDVIGIVRCREDAVRFTDMCNHLEDGNSFRAATKQITTGNPKGEKPRPWADMRVSILLSALRKEDGLLGRSANLLLEKMALSREEGAALVAKLRKIGRYELAERIFAYVNNTILFQSNKVLVKASTSNYTITKDGAEQEIANFCIEVVDRVFLRETNLTYYTINLIFNKKSFPMTLSKEGLENASVMEQELQMLHVNNLALLDKDGDRSRIFPVISDMANMRKYVIPYLKQSTTGLESVPGVDQLGWSMNNKIFVAPGFVIGMDVSMHERSRYMPQTKVFKFMDSAVRWDSHKVHDLPQVARDLVGMILANVVRSYLGLPTKPMSVQSTDTTRTLLRGMFQALGQHTVYPLKDNMSYQRGVPGIKGFPLLCNGFNELQINSSNFSHVVLGECGYSTGKEVTEEQIYAAGRTLQHALCRVVEWCMAEGAAGFNQLRGFTNTSILLKEGKWLMEHVCDQQPWEVSNTGLAHLESLMQQIDYEDVPDVMELHEGVTLVIKTEGLKFNEKEVLGDLEELNVECDFQKDRITMQAARCMPAFNEFYGKPPRPKNVLKTV